MALIKTERNSTKIKPTSKRKPTVKCKNCSRMCAYHCALVEYTIQHSIVLTIFCLILQTFIIAQMLSTAR